MKTALRKKVQKKELQPKLRKQYVVIQIGWRSASVPTQHKTLIKRNGGTT